MRSLVCGVLSLAGCGLLGCGSQTESATTPTTPTEQEVTRLENVHGEADLTSPPPGPPVQTEEPCPPPSPETQRWVTEIDTDPDILHNDYTPAVHALSDLDLEGACAVLPVLSAPEPFTRLRAQRVLEGVLLRRAGWVPGQGFSSREDDERAGAVLRDIGFAYDGTPEEREAAAARWQTWVETAAGHGAVE